MRMRRKIKRIIIKIKKLSANKIISLDRKIFSRDMYQAYQTISNTNSNISRKSSSKNNYFIARTSTPKHRRNVYTIKTINQLATIQIKNSYTLTLM